MQSGLKSAGADAMLLGMEKTHVFGPQPAFVTIDDLTQLAGALHSGLSLLSTYRHPLGVRKGVSKMRRSAGQSSVSRQAGKRSRLWWGAVTRVQAVCPG